jgi:hypothetical protein
VTCWNVDARCRREGGRCERQFGDGFHIDILGCRSRESNVAGDGITAAPRACSGCVAAYGAKLTPLGRFASTDARSHDVAEL